MPPRDSCSASRGCSKLRRPFSSRHEMAEISAKLLIVGGGPGGYVAAIRAGQLGLDTVLVEQDGREGGLGGTSLNVGCIRAKPVIHAADAFNHARQQATSAPFGIRVERP